MTVKPAEEEPAGKPADAVEVGRVIGAWGIKGGIKVKPFAADPQALFSSTRWYLQAGDGKPPVPALLRVHQAREQGDAIVATVDGFDDRNQAEAIAGATIFIARSSFPTPEAGEFYWVDLIGLAVRNRAGQELGRVIGLVETGPHCVIRIQGDDPAAEERLIPFVDAYVDKVDLAARLIEVDWADDF